MQRKLHIAAAFHAERINNIQRSRAQHLIFFIGKRHGRRDDDRVSSMNADRIHVFHRTHGDCIAAVIAHHFEFDFLPAGDAFFDEDLMDRRTVQTVLRNLFELFFRFSDAAARSAERKRGAHDHGVSDFTFGKIDGTPKRRDDF